MENGLPIVASIFRLTKSRTPNLSQQSICVNSKLFYSWAYSSMQGKRKTQEDAHCVSMNFGDYDHHLMMVCDGHGGSLAAKRVKEIMEAHLKKKVGFGRRGRGK